MEEMRIENNTVSVIGEVVSDFIFSHEVFGESFYLVDLAVGRLSNQVDIIPLMISERLVDTTEMILGKTIEAIGQLRSFNRNDGMKNRLMLSVFAKKVDVIEKFMDCKYENQIFLDGYICKKPIYRKTPLGREISDLILAVNRPYGKTDYIPCITWGRNAIFVSDLEVGARVKIWGRVQSREYTKKLSDTECETRIAYEVSVSRLEV